MNRPNYGVVTSVVDLRKVNMTGVSCGSVEAQDIKLNCSIF